MARSHVVSGLERRYARLLGAQLKRQHPSAFVESDLASIARVIRMFDPDWDRESVEPVAPRSPRVWGQRGRGVRAAMRVLQEADIPLSPFEIAHAAFAASGLPMPPKRTIMLSGADLIYSLRRHFGERLAVIEGQPCRYFVTPPAANSPPTGGSGAMPLTHSRASSSGYR
ncbi:MAG: hypothetical protein ABI898_04985 [Sphingomonadales bacterium]